MIEKQNITGIILAGGKSSRMKTDKGFLMYNGKPFMQHSINALQPLVSEIIIVSDKKEYDVFNLKRIEDCIKNAGPLAGVYSGLKQSSTSCNLILSCDIPLIKTSILEQLLNSEYMNFDVAQLKSQNETMPLISLYKKHCLNTFKALLDKGEKRLKIAIEKLHTKTIDIDFTHDKFVQNINTIEQLNELRNAIKY